MKKVLYIDMDNVLVDFQSGIDRLSLETLEEYKGRLDDVPNIFSLMEPVEGAIESFKLLASLFDVYILSTSPWNNSSAWHDKHVWVRKWLGQQAEKRLILSHHKHLNNGDYLIDDRQNKNGADRFKGELIHFGKGNAYPDWMKVVAYLINKTHEPDQSLLENLLDKAITIAKEAHQNQKDKYGAPYINHVMRVMEAGANFDERIVGVLHDIVEDTDWTFEKLLKEGFPERIVDAIRCVTKTSEQEDYEMFIARIISNPLAVQVKLHDLTDNMDIRRIPEINPGDLSRLNKYLKAYHKLMGIAK
jgi:5'(3')-deoxyribonucleotidase